MITRLRVKNYKSLKDLDLRLRPLNVFVGPNGAGKSNILEALELLSDLVNQGAGALHSRGTFDQVVWNGEIDRTISIIVNGDLDRKNKFEYDIQIVGSIEHYAIVGERFVLNPTKDARVLMELDHERRLVRVFDDLGKETGGFQGSRSEGNLRTASAVTPSDWLRGFVRELSQWCRFRFDSKTMRLPAAARHQLQVGEAGENLVVVLHTLQTEYAQEFERIIELLQVIMPTLRSIYTPLTPNGGTQLRIREESLTLPVGIQSLSDGTLHALAILTALNVPKPPQLMSFEEPENFVHPRVLQLLAEEFKGASNNSQICITTHSTFLVDNFSVSDIVVVEKEDGATKARRIPRKKGLYEALEELGLGDAWYSGTIGGVP